MRMMSPMRKGRMLLAASEVIRNAGRRRRSGHESEAAVAGHHLASSETQRRV